MTSEIGQSYACVYCGKPMIESWKSCCGEVHFEPVELCPECDSDDVIDCHAEASYSLPETNYKACCACNHQWGHE
jgi:hypothetical protein